MKSQPRGSVLTRGPLAALVARLQGDRLRPHFRRCSRWVEGRVKEWGRVALWSGGMALALSIFGAGIYVQMAASAPDSAAAGAPAAVPSTANGEPPPAVKRPRLSLDTVASLGMLTAPAPPPDPFQPLPLTETRRVSREYRRPGARSAGRRRRRVAARQWSPPPAPLAGLPILPPLPAVPGGLAPTNESPTAAPAPPAPPAQPVVTGIIQGDPAIVLATYKGKSYFLKVGEPLAEHWTLTSIHERSAVFNDGQRALEIPIRGGTKR